MVDERHNQTAKRFRGDSLLAFGLATIVIGIWLLRAGDPLLLTLWGLAFIINGGVSTITGLGILIGLWE